ncbi:MAG: TIGR03435 family protein [Acidobacteriota bacterium]|nr:TIGR03435 family protein [Acidobacteriota bacterium]
MRKLTHWILPLAMFSGSAVFAQNITGTWQGSLQAGKELRIVIKISTTDADTLKAVMYSIDQGGQPLPFGPVSRQGSTLKMSVPGLAAAYEGRVNADGNSITGTWTQGPNPLPLNLTRATAETAWTIPEPPVPLKPMRADASPGFEVATIKPSNPDAQGKGFMVRGRNFSTLNTSLSDLITFAYEIHAKQISGGPAWMETDKYDLAAVPDTEGAPSQKQWKAMIQKLLAERFKLTFHHDKKELSVYAIVLAKTGPKLTKSEGDPNGLPSLMFRGLGTLPARNASLTDFAQVMQGAVLDRPVVDQTGLAGKYDFTLTWTPDQFQFTSMGIKVPAPTEDPAAPPDLFTAMQQQLGLKLEATKAPADVIVIDHVEKPSAN